VDFNKQVTDFVKLLMTTFETILVIEKPLVGWLS
jgi:hypothetical protein